MPRAFTMMLFGAALAAAAPIPANAFLWPWQHHARYHRHSRKHSQQPANQTPPNCDEINAVAKRLTPQRYERAFRSATKEEQKIILQCEVEP